MQELNKSDFDKVRDIVKGIKYSLSIEATLQGNNPGRIFVDNINHPRIVLALTVEGYILAGDHEDPVGIRSLQKLFKEQILSGRVFIGDDDRMELIVHPPDWEGKLRDIIPTHEADKLPRNKYECSDLKLSWHDKLSDQYTVSPVDKRILSSTSLTIQDDVWEEIESSWGTSDNFLKKGFGFCILHKNQLVSWCIADCRAGDCIDVGVATIPQHRRKGLASVVTAATVEYCLNHGFKTVGWHCEQDNIGSWKTAEKVGFKKKFEYPSYYYLFDEAEHLGQLGWSCFKRGEYKKTTEYNEKLFALRENNPPHFYHLTAAAWAAQGEKVAAFKYLNKAVERGWKRADRTRQMKEFAILHDSAEWDKILRRMENIQ